MRLPRSALIARCTGVSTWKSTNTMPTAVSGPASELPVLHRADQRAGCDRDQRGQQAAENEQEPPRRREARRGLEQRPEELILLPSAQSSHPREGTGVRFVHTRSSFAGRQLRRPLAQDAFVQRAWRPTFSVVCQSGNPYTEQLDAAESGVDMTKSKGKLRTRGLGRDHVRRARRWRQAHSGFGETEL